jgi:hypothetical protein
MGRTTGQQGLLKNNDSSESRKIIDLNRYKMLRVEEPVNYGFQSISCESMFIKEQVLQFTTHL